MIFIGTCTLYWYWESMAVADCEILLDEAVVD